MKTPDIINQIRHHLVIIFSLVALGYCIGWENTGPNVRFNNRSYYLHSHYEVVLVKKVKLQGPAPSDTIVASAAQFVSLPYLHEMESKLDIASGFSSNLYLFAFVQFLDNFEKVDMILYTLDGESSSHIFKIIV